MRWLNAQWYRHKNVYAYCLSPLAWVYRTIIAARRFFYRCGLKKVTHFTVPVIVVGNITVGGTGKTPLVAWLVTWLRTRGFKPGIVSRGYGGTSAQPQNVTANSDPHLVGDEAVLLAQHTHCPMVVAPQRVAAVTKLLNDHDCDIVVSDDGLQHYALGRTVEIAVVDGVRRFGNGLCLPAGPLREPVQRLQSVDFIVANGKAHDTEYAMCLYSGDIYNIKDPEKAFDLKLLNSNTTVHAVAGIGHPQRFFQQLAAMGFNIICHEFPDHYSYKASDLAFPDDAMIIMTAKDAVKCQSFADARYWCLPVEVKMDERFAAELQKKLL